jgi:hypothetical protein
MEGTGPKHQPLPQDLSGQIRVLYTIEASFRTPYEIVDSLLQFKLLLTKHHGISCVLLVHKTMQFSRAHCKSGRLSRSSLEAVIAGTRAISAPLPVVLFIKVLQKCLPPAFSLQKGNAIISHILCSVTRHFQQTYTWLTFSSQYACIFLACSIATLKVSLLKLSAFLNMHTIRLKSFFWYSMIQCAGRSSLPALPDS